MRGFSTVAKKKATRKKTAETPARKTTGRTPAGKKAVSGKRAAPKKKAAAKTAARTATPAGRAGTTSAAKPSRMTARQKGELREALFALRERLVNQVNSLKSASLTRSDSVYSMEDGTDAFDRQFGLTLANSEVEALQNVDEALRSLEQGTYGLCDECGGAIEVPRLKALPFVRTCIGCQSQIEKKRGAFGPILPPA
jgi:DnaK suppressor protein